MEDLTSSVCNVTNRNPATSQHSPLALSFYVLPLLGLFYLTLIALLRDRRLRSNRMKYAYTTPASFASMTNEDAHLIQLDIAELEFPFTFEKALQFALFRTYGIPSVSKLLAQTGQFSEVSTASKRYVDTTVLVAEILGYHPTNARSIEAIGRMNYIHSHYQRSGKILDDDLLYTLALFALEPIRWIDRYEWRRLEDFEKCAIGTFWKAIGDAMGIPYNKFKSGAEGWKDGLQWLYELAEWSDEYEKRFMSPDKNNHKTAEQTVAILLFSIPGFLKPYGKKIILALMDDRLRNAMMYEKPGSFYFNLVSILFTVRKTVLRYLMFPRPDFLRVHNTTREPSQDDRYYMKVYETHPYYVKPTFWNRFEPRAWSSWIMGLPVPGDDGDRYWPKGYRISEIGPESMRGKGEDYTRASKERLVGERMKGCPFGRPKED